MILQNSSIAFLTRFTPLTIQVVVFKEIIDFIGILDGKFDVFNGYIYIALLLLQ